MNASEIKHLEDPGAGVLLRQSWTEHMAENKGRFSVESWLWFLVQCIVSNHRAALSFACDSKQILFIAARTCWKVEGFCLYACFPGRLTFFVYGGQPFYFLQSFLLLYKSQGLCG